MVEYNKDELVLYPHQQKQLEMAVNSILRWRAFLETSIAGAGKTYISVHVAKALKVPALVICPKRTVPKFHMVMGMEGVPGRVYNYERIRGGIHGVYKIDEREDAWGHKRIFDSRMVCDPTTLIIFDECHALGNKSTKRSKVARAAIAGGYRCLFLSATPAEHIQHLAVVGQALDLFRDPRTGKRISAAEFQKRYTQKYQVDKYSLVHYVMEKAKSTSPPKVGGIQELPNVPELRVQGEIVSLGDAEKLELERAYNDVQAKLKEIRQKAWSATSKEIKMQERGAYLAALSYARQASECSKIPSILDLCAEYRLQGYSVVVMACFRDTVTSIVTQMKEKCSVIMGGLDTQEAVRRFQANETQIVVATIASGGESIDLHDTKGTHPRIMILSPDYTARHLRQAIGRCQRTGAKSQAIAKLLFSDHPIDAKLMETILPKLKAINSITNQDLIPDVFVIEELLPKHDWSNITITKNSLQF